MGSSEKHHHAGYDTPNQYPLEQVTEIKFAIFHL